MATETNMSSVLAKLMGIDKPLTPHGSHRGHRVLSENYVQNIATVARREKAFLYLDDVDSELDDSEGTVELSGGVGVIDYQILFCPTEKSFLARGDNESSLSGDRKRRKYVSLGDNGMHCRGRRMSSSYNSTNSPIHGSLSSREVAKQITGQVKHTVWHSCAELSKSRPGIDKSSEYDERARITSSACLFDSEKKHEASSFGPVKECTSCEPRKTRKQLSARWRTQKGSQDVRVHCGGYGNFSTCCTANVNGRPVLAARYLSKPLRFPSAWVPRSRARHFTINKSWCLKPGKADSKQRHDSEDIVGYKDVQSSSELSSLDSEKSCLHQAASLVLNDSVKLAEQNSYVETFTATESSSNWSTYSDIESPTYHEPHIILNETGGRHLEKDVSQDSSVESLPLNNNFSLSLDNEEVHDEERIKLNSSSNYRREDASAKSTTCILRSNTESWEYQLKNRNNASEPRSPVSSLDGPEACTHVPNLIAEVANHLSVSVENDAHGLQRKFQLIETMSLESVSEGREILVSSEEGDNESSISLYQNDPQLMEMYHTSIKQSWEFSYVVDVVVELGLQLRDLEMESKTWCLRGYVLEPTVFDMLEKKYGKYKSWEKSERRLLFDRLNSGLLEIVKPSVTFNSWKEPAVKRLCPREKCQQVNEEVVWSLLVNQQEEFKRYSSDKKFRKELLEWLDSEEDTDFIVQDIQSLLIDELIEEFVCTEASFVESVDR